MPLQSDFLEDTQHFPVLHCVFPFIGSYIFFDNLWIVVSVIYLWESFEAVLYWTADDYCPGGCASSANLWSRDMSQESVRDSLIGDPLMMVLGILLFELMKYRSDRWYTSFRKKRLAPCLWLVVVGASSSYVLEMILAGYRHFGYLYYTGLTMYFCVLFYHPTQGFRDFTIALALLLVVPMFPLSTSYVYRTWMACGAVVLWKLLLLMWRS